MHRTDQGAPRRRASRTDDGPGADLLGVIWRHRLVVALLALVVAAAGFVAATTKPDRYTAQATLFMSSTSSFDGVGGGSFVNDPDRYISNQAGVVMSGPVLAAAVDAGVSDSVDELRRELDVSAALGRDEIRIHAEGATPEEAVARADAVATAYREFSKAAVQTQTDQLVQLSTTAAERAQVLKRAAVFGDGVAFAELAALPEAPSSPAPLRDGLFGLLVGLALGIGLAYLLEHRSVRRVNGPVPVADRAAAEAVATAPDGAAGPAPSIRHDLESAGSAR